MANATEIKSRIDSIQDTKKITKAMYMISSAKLTKARQTLEETEPFFYEIQNSMRRLLRHAPHLNHPYFEGYEDPEEVEGSRKSVEDKVIGYLVITADKGLAGAYNHNVEKLAEKLVEDTKEKDKLFVVGESGRRYFTSRGLWITRHFQYTAQSPTLGRARHITEELIAQFREGKIDEIYIVYTAMSEHREPEATYEKLLPLPLLDDLKQQALSLESMGTYSEEFKMYPSPEVIMENLVHVYIASYIYGALVESYACEQSSRMQAMKTATDSADDMLHDLSIQYNRVRQSAITQEITEVIGGAKALKQKKARKKAYSIAQENEETG